MTDMIAGLAALPASMKPELRITHDVVIKRALPFERTPTLRFVAAYFGAGWAEESSVGFCRQPASVLVALHQGAIVGFAVYDCVARGFFGPMGVDPAHRGKKIGAALTLEALIAMRSEGYGYAIIGGIGPADFYARTVGAVEIPGSEPGIYGDPVTMIHEKPS